MLKKTSKSDAFKMEVVVLESDENGLEKDYGEKVRYIEKFDEACPNFDLLL